MLLQQKKSLGTQMFQTNMLFCSMHYLLKPAWKPRFRQYFCIIAWQSGWTAVQINGWLLWKRSPYTGEGFSSRFSIMAVLQFPPHIPLFGPPFPRINFLHSIGRAEGGSREIVFQCMKFRQVPTSLPWIHKAALDKPFFHLPHRKHGKNNAGYFKACDTRR